MIHEIYPKTYYVDYKNATPEPGDQVFAFDDEKLLLRLDEKGAVLPVFGEFPGVSEGTFIYLFSIDDERYFMPKNQVSSASVPTEGYQWEEFMIFRTTGPRHTAFAAVTAQQLYQWYRSHEYCGRCGVLTKHAETERACICPDCGLVEYPKLSPVVIVAVTNGEHLLVTRYKNRPHRRYALVAGFSEIGESFEDTVIREVFEETGVRVKNIRYYKSQPWGFTSTLLAGFYCDLDGDPAITVDEEELSEAIWLLREDIPPSDIDIALTAEMMEMFRTGQIQ